MAAPLLKALRTERRHNENLLMFLLRRGRGTRYSADVRPGHPLYERIRAALLAGMAAEELDEDEVPVRLNARLDEARRNSAASKPFMSHDRND